MKIKTLQWNIGGGRICEEGKDTTSPESYTEYGIDSIIDVLKDEQPNIITLQETHESSGYCQTQIIADALGYSYWVNDSYDESFIEKGQRFGQGVISRYPITEHRFTDFTNPNFNFTNDDGIEIYSKNGGLTACIIEYADAKFVQVETFHMTPFHFFNVNLESEPAKKVLREVENLIGKSQLPTIVQADFNLDYPRLSHLLPKVFAAGIQEVSQETPTTPKGKRLDHFLYVGLNVVNSRVIRNVKTDHYPIINKLQV